MPVMPRLTNPVPEEVVENWTKLQLGFVLCKQGRRISKGSHAGSIVTEVKHHGIWVRKEGRSEAGGQCLET